MSPSTTGFGVCQIPELDECERCVMQAIEVGYRSIDTPAAYMNEEAIGMTRAETFRNQEL